MGWGIRTEEKLGRGVTSEDEELLARMVPAQTERVKGRTAADNAMMERDSGVETL